MRHALGLEQSLLARPQLPSARLPVRDVAIRLEDALDAVAAADELEARRHDDLTAVLGVMPDLALPGAVLTQRRFDLRPWALVDRGKQVVTDRAQGLCLGEAVELLGAAVPRLDLAPESPDDDGVEGEVRTTPPGADAPPRRACARSRPRRRWRSSREPGRRRRCGSGAPAGRSRPRRRWRLRSRRRARTPPDTAPLRPRRAHWRGVPERPPRRCPSVPRRSGSPRGRGSRRPARPRRRARGGPRPRSCSRRASESAARSRAVGSRKACSEPCRGPASPSGARGGSLWGPEAGPGGS